MTTDATGQATFAVPFTAPAGLPVITATATDPQGNTSEVSSLRPDTQVVSMSVIRLATGQPVDLLGVLRRRHRPAGSGRRAADPTWEI